MVEKIGLIIIVFVIVATMAIVMAFPFMWIWNYSMVAACSFAKNIQYWQSFWMVIFFNLWIVGSRVSSGGE